MQIQVLLKTVQVTVLVSLVHSTDPLVASLDVQSLSNPETSQLPSYNPLSSPAEGTLPNPVTLQLPSFTHLSTQGIHPIQ